MTTTNHAFITQHRHFLKDWKQSQVYRGLSGEVRSGFLRIMQEEFWPGYHTDLDCGVCVGELLGRLEDKMLEYEKQTKA